MSDSYLTINAIERISRKELRVYGIEKGKAEQQSYEQAARSVGVKKAGKAQAAGNRAEYGEKMETVPSKDAGDIYGEMAQTRKTSLENRQQKLAFEKTIQGSRARTMRAAAAYESSFMVY